MFPIFQVGPLAVPVAPLTLLLGVLLSLSLVEKEAARVKLDGGTVSNLVFAGWITAVAGARLGYVAQHLDSYVSDPLGIFALDAAALDPLAGLLIGVAAAAIYGRRRKLPLRLTLDAVAPGLALMGVALGLAHLASGDAYGSPANLPWSIYLWDQYRHPSQVYEIIGAVSVLGMWWWARDKRAFEGFMFLLVVGLSAALVIFLEAFRGDSLILAGGWRVTQIAGLILLGMCLVSMKLWGHRRA
jgi:phosphatidylglycerol:prolipoprotein diacylglycerol transferase